MPTKPMKVEIKTALPSAALLSLFNNNSSVNASTTTSEGITTIRAEWAPPAESSLELPLGPFRVTLRHCGDAAEITAPAFLASMLTGLPTATLDRGQAVWRLPAGQYGPIGVRGLASLMLTI